MSGIELAGMVLGVIPVVFKTLTILSSGLSTFQRGRKYENGRERTIPKLENEQMRLLEVCDKLLLGLVPQSLMEKLMNDSRGLLQSEAALQRSFGCVFGEAITSLKLL